MRRLIVRHRSSGPVRLLHRLASTVESAYANEGVSFDENGERWVIQRLAPSKFRVAFDVGANKGDWSLAAMQMWPECQIHAFEVAPETFGKLRARISQYPAASRFFLNGFGLADHNYVQEMFYFPEHPDLTCDIRRHDGFQITPFQAQLRTADSYADEHQVDMIDFVKIDVEGAEFRVLKGLEDRLSNRRVHCLQFEYGAFSTQTRVLLADYYEFLSTNYWIGKIYPTRVDFRSYDWRMEDFRFANYCVVSKSKPELRDLLS